MLTFPVSLYLRYFSCFFFKGFYLYFPFFCYSFSTVPCRPVFVLAFSKIYGGHKPPKSQKPSQFKRWSISFEFTGDRGGPKHPERTRVPCVKFSGPGYRVVLYSKSGLRFRGYTRGYPPWVPISTGTRGYPRDPRVPTNNALKLRYFNLDVF